MHIGHKHKGTGLGLAISKQLVELQGGTITVKSREGEGTSFTFTLPFQKSDTEIIQNTNEIQTAPASIEGCKLLVAEDNIMNQKYISSLLTKWNINFSIASDGRKAVEKAQKEQYDIILMDIQMPNMDGYEATIKIRNTKGPNQNIPIIALTASAMLDQKSKALSVGMNDFISKPFAPNNLLNTIQNYVNSSKLAIKNSLKGNSLLDYNRLTQLYGNDKEYAADMFQTFLNDVLPDFLVVNELINTQDWVSLGTYAHKLKPTLGMVGLTSLEAQMHEIEKIAKENPDANTLRLLWNDFQVMLEQGIPILEEELNKFTK